MNAAEAVSNCESSGGETDADRNTTGLSRLGGIGGGNLSSTSHTHNITHDYTFHITDTIVYFSNYDDCNCHIHLTSPSIPPVSTFDFDLLVYLILFLLYFIFC